MVPPDSARVAFGGIVRDGFTGVASLGILFFHCILQRSIAIYRIWLNEYYCTRRLYSLHRLLMMGPNERVIKGGGVNVDHAVHENTQVNTTRTTVLDD